MSARLYLCPACHKELYNDEEEFCPNCGQYVGDLFEKIIEENIDEPLAREQEENIILDEAFEISYEGQDTLSETALSEQIESSEIIQTGSTTQKNLETVSSTSYKIESLEHEEEVDSEANQIKHIIKVEEQQEYLGKKIPEEERDKKEIEPIGYTSPSVEKIHKRQIHKIFIGIALSLAFLVTMCVGLYWIYSLTSVYVTWDGIPKKIEIKFEDFIFVINLDGQSLDVFPPLPPPTNPIQTLAITTQISLETDTPMPSQSIPKLQIAFQVKMDGTNEIFLINEDGSEMLNLTRHPADDRSPSWSPDGQKIAFYSNRDGDYELFIYDLKTNAISQITHNSCHDYSPVWSPQGDALVYYSICDGNREIYLINLGTLSIQQLTHTENVYNIFPFWFPDGKQVTYSSNEAGGYYIYVMDSSGGRKQKIVKGCSGVISPNGEQMVFTEYCFEPGNIYLYNFQTASIKAITSNGNCAYPNWSPDGTRIVFQLQEGEKSTLWTMFTDGSDWKQLTYDGIHVAPVWQPRH